MIPVDTRFADTLADLDCTVLACLALPVDGDKVEQAIGELLARHGVKPILQAVFFERAAQAASVTNHSRPAQS